MRCRASACLVLSITLFCSMELLLQIPTGNALVSEEESTLETVRERFDLPEWTGDPCNTVAWITCSSDNMSVLTLNLQQRNLLGTIPAEIGKFRSTVKLELNNNNLTGGIPSSIFNLSSLTSLNLSYNPLGGPIPAVTGSLYLNTIDLTLTQVTGNVPDSFKSLSQLATLNLANNPQLTGSLSVLNGLIHLKALNGSRCGFSGRLPSLDSAGGLESLDMQMNDFSGQIPDSFFVVGALQKLYLNNNPKLSGGIPDMRSLVNLATFVISDCDLSGPLPDGMFAKNLYLEVIGLGNNRFTSFPTDLQALIYLREIDVHNNNITGRLPELPSAEAQTATQNGGIKQLIFGNNHFSGEIPSSWYKATNLEGIFLAFNNLSGVIANDIGSLTRLRYLNLSHNNFSGTLPEQIGTLVNLETLDLSNNQFNGTVPETMASLPNLKLLILDNNRFGGIPKSLLDRKDIIKSYTNNPLNADKKPGVSMGIIVGTIIGACAIIGIFTSAIIFYMLKRRIKPPDEISQVQGFTRKQIKRLTENYKTIIGKGGFGSVYYGKLAGGKEVAVKVRKSDSKQGSEEFLNEVRLLSRLHHRNLINLVGYCLEGSQQMLVYDFMPQGTLHNHLYRKGPSSREMPRKSDDALNRKPLPWKTRLNIVLDVARGLEYLHHDCNPPIIHRDVKSSNILLSRKLKAKLGDLGISKQASGHDQGFNKSGITTVIKGTWGYLDPEYFTRRRLTTKSDVYSFGIVLLEIITAKRPQTDWFPDSEAGNLIEWVRNAVNHKRLECVVDPELRLQGDYDKEVMLKVAQLALSCTLRSGVDRPEMGEVARSLTQALQMEGECIDSSGSSSGKTITEKVVPVSKEEELTVLSSPPSSSSFRYNDAFLSIDIDHSYRRERRDWSWGGFGTVYTGKLHDVIVVAIKRSNWEGSSGRQDGLKAALEATFTDRSAKSRCTQLLALFV
ncbi:hypothetical protein R1flu_011899 [Riccia fluitans]|uniref:Protein kinase domain-containing protein n=1 Tax=Riccia fluitans TaxID=41844 RepID=A0ABD1ZD93_9MARC